MAYFELLTVALIVGKNCGTKLILRSELHFNFLKRYWKIIEFSKNRADLSVPFFINVVKFQWRSLYAVSATVSFQKKFFYYFENSICRTAHRSSHCMRKNDLWHAIFGSKFIPSFMTSKSKTLFYNRPLKITAFYLSSHICQMTFFEEYRSIHCRNHCKLFGF